MPQPASEGSPCHCLSGRCQRSDGGGGRRQLESRLLPPQCGILWACGGCCRSDYSHWPRFVASTGAAMNVIVTACGLVVAYVLLSLLRAIFFPRKPPAPLEYKPRQVGGHAGQ